MKNQLTIFFASMLLLLVSIETLSAQNVENRNLDAFDKIEVSVSFDVYLEKGSSESVKLDLRGISPSEIITEVSGRTLKIYKKRGNWNMRSSGKLIVTYRELSAIKNSGSSDMYGDDPIRADDLDIVCSGSGDISLEDIESEELTIRISGSSDMDLRGSCVYQDIKISGSGDYDASDVECDEVDIAISGSGNASVTARGKLRARVSGSGDIKYRGSPEYLETDISGSGDIRSMR